MPIVAIKSKTAESIILIEYRYIPYQINYGL